MLSNFNGFSLVTSKILDSCIRRNDNYQPMNENVITVKLVLEKAGNENPEGFIFKIVLRIAQFKYNLNGRTGFFVDLLQNPLCPLI